MSFEKFDGKDTLNRIEDSQSRFNEGYDDGNEPVVFYYNREERLRHSPKIVQDYYSGNIKTFKPGLFKALVSTRTNRLIFIALLISFGTVFFANFFGPAKNATVISGVDTSLTAFSYNDTLYVSLKMAAPDKKHSETFKNAKAFPVSAVLKCFDVDRQLVFSDELEGVYEGKELFLRTNCRDYDIFTVTVDFSFYGENRLLETSSIEHR